MDRVHRDGPFIFLPSTASEIGPFNFLPSTAKKKDHLIDDYVFQKVLRSSTHGVLYGLPKVHKTGVSLSLAFQIVHGGNSTFINTF